MINSVLVCVVATGMSLMVMRRNPGRRMRLVAHHVIDLSQAARDIVRDQRRWSIRAHARELWAQAIATLNRVVSSRARARRISLELPVVLDFTVLCLSAGVSTADALQRIGELGGGVIAAECRVVSREHALGVPLTTALRDSARREPHPAWGRTVDHLVDALDRGTPLVATLVTVAAEERAATTRALTESGSIREVAMLVPLVFVILPVTVIFAVFPGLVALEFVV